MCQRGELLSMENRIWLVTAFGSERQYAGNSGYADEVSHHYRFDSHVPNCRQVRQGDRLVLRDKRSILGVAQVVDLESIPGTKILNLCPACGKSGLKERKKLTPRFRCHGCGNEFERPRKKEASVTEYVARFGETFRPCPLPLEMDRVQPACPRYNPQHAIQEIQLEKLGTWGKAIVAASASARGSRASPAAPTADPVELDRRVRSLLSSGRVGRPAGQAVPSRVACAPASAFARDPAVKAWVLQEAAGMCESCGESGPFQMDDGGAFLEVHHVQRLTDGGPDTVENAVALCPNCHRAMHLARDRDSRVKRLKQTVSRIKQR